MNKSEFIKEISNRTGFDENKCNEINNIVEETFIIGKNNKEKLIENLKAKLNFSEEEADNIYNIISEILGSEILNKLKHPFGK